MEFENIFAFGDPPNYDPGSEASLKGIAARENRSPGEVAYDLMLVDGGRGMLYSPFANYAERSLDVCGDMIADPNTIIGLGDGGAAASPAAHCRDGSCAGRRGALQRTTLTA